MFTKGFCSRGVPSVRHAIYMKQTNICVPQRVLLREELRQILGSAAPSTHRLHDTRAEGPTLATTSGHASTDLGILRLACQFPRAHLRQISRRL